MSKINISQYKSIHDKLKLKENSVTTISESFKFREMITIYSNLISNLTNIIHAEKTYYDAKDRLIYEDPEYYEELSLNLLSAIVNIQRIYRDAEIYVNRLITLTEISELKFEKEYFFEFSEDRTEMTIITGLKLLEQYLSN
jgi:hypothetical protein